MGAVKAAGKFKAASKSQAVASRTRKHADEVAERRRRLEQDKKDAYHNRQKARAEATGRLQKHGLARQQRQESKRGLTEHRRATATLAVGSGKSGAAHGLGKMLDLETAITGKHDLSGLHVMVPAGSHGSHGARATRMGVVRFAGKVQFASGLWLGIELLTPDGKHDGEMKGNRYFRCKPNHGAFVPARKATVADNAAVEAAVEGKHNHHHQKRESMAQAGKQLFDAGTKHVYEHEDGHKQ